MADAWVVRNVPSGETSSDHNMGRGYVAEHRGDYHDAIVNKKNTVILVDLTRAPRGHRAGDHARDILPRGEVQEQRRTRPDEIRAHVRRPERRRQFPRALTCRDSPSMDGGREVQPSPTPFSCRSSAASRRRALARRVWGAPKGASRDREP